MPHQCIKCGNTYEDGSKELLKGCNNCGGKFFFFIKQPHLEEVKEKVINLTEEEKEKIEKDVMDIVGIKPERETPIILDLESIRVLQPGKFEIDLAHLFHGRPVVYKMEKGKYIIDLASTFQLKKKKTKLNL